MKDCSSREGAELMGRTSLCPCPPHAERRPLVVMLAPFPLREGAPAGKGKQCCLTSSSAAKCSMLIEDGSPVDGLGLYEVTVQGVWTDRLEFPWLEF